MPFKLHVADRNYESFDIINASTLSGDDSIPSLNPVEHKLLNQDIFDYDTTTKKVIIQHSTTRSMPNIPGVLVLEGNKSLEPLLTSYKNIAERVIDGILLAGYSFKSKIYIFSKIHYYLRKIL